MNFLCKLAVPFIAIAACASAQVVSSFNSLGGANYTIGGNWNDPGSMVFSSGVLTVGSTATADNGFTFADIEGGIIDLTSVNTLYYAATVNSGDLATGFSVLFADSNGNYVRSASINTSGWIVGSETFGSVNLTSTGLGDASNIQYFSITGDSSQNVFKMSFDTLTFTATAVPEPSTYAVLFGAAALGLAVWRKRRKAI